jgi:hypothetical protein
MKTKTLFVAILFFALSSCSEEEKNGIFSDEEYQITGSVLIPETELQDPWTIAVSDSLLFVGNLNGNPQVDIFYKDGSTKLRSMIETGEGPYDVRALDAFKTINDNDVIVTDLFSRKMFGVQYHSRDSFVTYPIMSKDNYPEDLWAVIDKNHYYDKRYNVFTSFSSNGRIGMIDKEAQSAYYYYPITDAVFEGGEALDSIRYNNLFSDLNMTSNDKTGKIAFAAMMHDDLDIFSVTDDYKLKHDWHYEGFRIKDNFVKVITLDGAPPQAFFSNKSKYAYHDVTSNDENVYALYSGKTGENREDRFHGYANEIRVFDWNGKHRYILRTDYPVKRITVDNDRLYGISLDQDDSPIIVCFDLKSL